MTIRFDRPVCLDVTRLVSRVGAGPHTGIDRVEYGYLRQLLSWDGLLFCLARTATGFVLLDRIGASRLKARIDGTEPWGPADILGHVSRRITPARRAAEADLRRLATASAFRGGAPRLLTRHLPAGTVYLNTGHSNLSAEMLAAVRATKSATIAAVIHDTIPLRLPETQRPEAPARLLDRLSAVSAHADAVVCVSAAEREHVAAAFAHLGRTPPLLVAHPGVDVVPPDAAALAGLDLPPGPIFVTVGTIEARKNHALLLDVWERLAADPPAAGMPHLFVVGRRGWNDPALFDRLDRLRLGPVAVTEIGDLSDGGRSALLARSRALLFPSRAEGFGFPPLEAMVLGVPVVSAPLPVYRELAGDVPVYADPDDLYQWMHIVRNLGEGPSRAIEQRRRAESPNLPTWQDHLNQVLSTIG